MQNRPFPTTNHFHTLLVRCLRLGKALTWLWSNVRPHWACQLNALAEGHHAFPAAHPANTTTTPLHFASKLPALRLQKNLEPLLRSLRAGDKGYKTPHISSPGSGRMYDPTGHAS
jgi:hypothetical protein